MMTTPTFAATLNNNGQREFPQGDICWRAMMARDERFNGAFVYGVRSTGIYCRPTCGARRPRRKQVAFFPTPAAAERSGFRACRRCTPETTTEHDTHLLLVQRVCAYIETRLGESISLSDLSEHAGLSSAHLQRTFKRIMGISPRQYLKARRMATFKSEVREGRSVTAAMYEAGFGSSSRLYEDSSRELGMTPATYRRGGRGMSVAYTIVDSPLGRLLVAATEAGVCSVCLGDSDAALVAALREDYPAAQITLEERDLGRTVSAILEHLDGQRPHLDLPIDVQATAFQRLVWEELRSIPSGATRSYQDIAAAIGRPTAARAVGRACATNRVSLLIPCHRAVGAHGNLTGYRWGIERKRALLAREQAATALASHIEGSTDTTGR